jgi:thiamine pyrophosphokinase
MLQNIVRKYYLFVTGREIMRCTIIAAGEFYVDSELDVPGLTIAVDGGYKAFLQLNREPDLIIGDFDSLGFVPRGDNVTLLPEMKDDTDMFAAIELGLQHECDEFHIFGGVGGRLDHQICNLQCLLYLSKRSIPNYLYGDNWITRSITNGEVRFPETYQGLISVIPIGGEARGVTISGLVYPLDHAIMRSDRPLGLSNRFASRPSCVCVEDGSLLLSWEKQNSEKGKIK